jgi:hypothetical protein
MTVGYRNSAGTDLAALFMAYTSGTKAAITGYRRSDAVDLRDIFQPYTQGAKKPATGIRNSAGTDMSDLFQNIDVPLFTVNINDLYTQKNGLFGVTSALASYDLYSDGTAVAVGDSTTNFNWGSPTTAGAGNSYWVRATLSSGSTPSGSALNTWHQLSIARGWSVFRSSSSVGTTTSVLTMQIATDSGGSNIIDTATITLVANIDI